MQLITKDQSLILLKDRRVKDLLDRSAVICTSVGPHSYFFVVINRYYQRFEVKIDKEGSKVLCSCAHGCFYGLSQKNLGVYCYHVNACFVWLFYKTKVI